MTEVFAGASSTVCTAWRIAVVPMPPDTADTNVIGHEDLKFTHVERKVRASISSGDSYFLAEQNTGAVKRVYIWRWLISYPVAFRTVHRDICLGQPSIRSNASVDCDAIYRVYLSQIHLPPRIVITGVVASCMDTVVGTERTTRVAVCSISSRIQIAVSIVIATLNAVLSLGHVYKAVLSLPRAGNCESTQKGQYFDDCPVHFTIVSFPERATSVFFWLGLFLLTLILIIQCKCRNLFCLRLPLKVDSQLMLTLFILIHHFLKQT